MKTILVILLGFFISIQSWAYKADPFKGWYQILSGMTQPSEKLQMDEKKYMFIDSDLLKNIWTKYADGPLPKDLEEYKDEPSILVAFTHRDTLFLSLERGALFGNGYLAIQGSGNNMMELARKPDANFDLGLRENNQISRYLLAPPTEQPSAPPSVRVLVQKNRLILPTEID